MMDALAGCFIETNSVHTDDNCLARQGLRVMARHAACSVFISPSTLKRCLSFHWMRSCAGTTPILLTLGSILLHKPVHILTALS